MKVYQVHIRDEDYDYITNTYLSEDKAKSEVKKLEDVKKKIEEAALKCDKCPVNQLTKRKYEKNKHKVMEYCDKPNIRFFGNECLCDNEADWWFRYENEFYYYKEIDVIE